MLCLAEKGQPLYKTPDWEILGLSSLWTVRCQLMLGTSTEPLPSPSSWKLKVTAPSFISIHVLIEHKSKKEVKLQPRVLRARI